MTADRAKDRSLLFHVEGEDLVGFIMREQLIAGLLREGLKVLYRSRIGGEDPKDLPAPQLRQGFLGAQDRQWTIEAAHIQILVESRHRLSCTLEARKLYTKPHRR